MAKTLIAFFSRAGENYFGGSLRTVAVGNTELVADRIRALTGADCFRIEMAEPYSERYMTCIDEAKRDLRAHARPKLAAEPGDLSGYDTVVLAYPNYWGTAPMAVFTFLEKADLFGKTILPLCTNEGSGMGASERDIARACPGARLAAGLAVTGSRAADAGAPVEAWLKANGLL